MSTPVSRNSMPYVMATLRLSRRSGQINLRSCIHLTDGIVRTFCDLDGRKLLNQLALDCGKVRRAKWPIPSSLLQQQSCQNLCCWLFQLHRRGSFSCRSDTASHITLQSSLATCHPVQCRPNMRVANCKNY